VVWCVSGPGIHGKLQCLVRRCTVRQTTNVAEDGIKLKFAYISLAIKFVFCICTHMSFFQNSHILMIVSL